jgi:GNAT superfamily N-acetyltransferase
MELQLRNAETGDKPAIRALIAESARGLSLGHYSPQQVEAALQSCFGVDSQLIADRTYFLAMDGDRMAGCGGWSFRETLFGSDREKNRNAKPVDPVTGRAKIRAFFVKPDYARMGVGSRILQHCETEAWLKGFRNLELMATLPGITFYTRYGYLPGAPVVHTLENQVTIEFLHMTKHLFADRFFVC